MKIKHVKLTVEDLGIDSRYQRDLDQARATAMAKKIELDRIGVPVVAQRPGHVYIVLDGQHRVSALNQAGMGKRDILCEVHEGLNLIEEAALFLKLNGGRKPVGEYDKYRAELVARVPVALEIEKIVTGAGLRIARSMGRNAIMAIAALRYVHNAKKNLAVVLDVLKQWNEGDPMIFRAELIKGVAEFLATYPSADVKWLLKNLEKHSPDRVRARIEFTTNKADNIPPRDAACIVLRDIYNHRSKVKLLPLHRIREEDAA